ncbi:MAG: hypothetical protein RL189_207 [Pseudomonadota bacterium]|jgi:16S rRNA (uracil1498-N3)-methyltransferase
MEYKQVWRFYVDRKSQDLVAGQAVQLSPDEAHYAAAVLRLAAGEQVELADGDGWTARAVLERVEKKGVIATLHECTQHPAPARRVVALVGITKPGALDEIIQVCVEAGVAELVLCKADKTTSRQEIKLEKVIRQIGEICRITKSPWSMRITCAESFAAAMQKAREQYTFSKLLICDERPAHAAEWASQNTPHLLQESGAFTSGDLLFAVGPEASFSAAEYEYFLSEESAGRAGFVSLGPRILRTPAAVAAAAYLLSACVESKTLPANSAYSP